jgi:hypothetical protein
MPDKPQAQPSVPEVRARLHEVARMLQKSGALDPDARSVLAELVDELGVLLRSSGAPPAEVAHLADSAAQLAESLHRQQERGLPGRRATASTPRRYGQRPRPPSPPACPPATSRTCCFQTASVCLQARQLHWMR